ncbi:unnamed protein product, partial [Amoebophrya sp. A120]|eukprot:GSA120T00001147001.1
MTANMAQEQQTADPEDTRRGHTSVSSSTAAPSRRKKFVTGFLPNQADVAAHNCHEIGATGSENYAPAVKNAEAESAAPLYADIPLDGLEGDEDFCAAEDVDFVDE